MGVQGLWSLLGPVARPTRLESLRNKRIAVDASIWIHQFMRTMRDNEGNELRNGHLLGFFRRLCKLLFFDIKPVFVFDGGAPTLKRITIRDRRKRREGLQRNQKVTARKILRAQLKCKLLLEKEKKLHGESITQQQQEVSLPVSKQPLDPYQLPPQPQSNSKLDTRFSTEQELKSFVNQIDHADIDIDSERFQSLPTEVQYELIQDLKIKSRQTSFHHVEQMASADPLRFSKQQIELLQYRNQIMQRALQVNNVSSGTAEVAPTRVAGERGRQYVLYKNEDASKGLGWSLPGATADAPVDLDSSQTSDLEQSNGIYPNTDKSQITNQTSDLEQTTYQTSDLEPTHIIYQNSELAQTTYKNINPSNITNQTSDLEEHNQTADIYQAPDQTINLGKPEQTSDAVKNAIQSNPRLAALAYKLLHGEEEENKENRAPDTYQEEAFEEVEPTLMNDIRAYADDDEALDSVLSLMYRNETDEIVPQNNQILHNQVEMDPYDNGAELKVTDELDLDVHQFYNLWVSRMPDSYVYLYSDGEQHLYLIRDMIEEEDIDVLRDKLRLMRKRYGKTKETDLLALESYRFIITFIKSVIEWNLKNFGSQSDEEFEQVYDGSHLLQPIHQNGTDNDDLLQTVDNNMAGDGDLFQYEGQSIVLTDDEEDIQFIESSIEEEVNRFLEEEDQEKEQEGSKYEETSQVDQYNYQSVNIDIRESLLSGLTNISQSQKEDDDVDSEHTNTEQASSVSIDPATTTNDILDKAYDSEDEQKNDILIDPTTEDPTADALDKGYNSEDGLMEEVEAEDEEYAKFLSDISKKDLDHVRTELNNDMQQLYHQQKKDLGNSDQITDQMVQDIQHLLELFGVPFVASPMEAEAQCAELEKLGLIDGTVTDDSDAFLFGSSLVYKNMFNQQRLVECYQKQDIEKEMALNRKKLIQLGFLLGTDYTEGIAGVGPVAAMEILHEFSAGDDDEEDLKVPLQKFKQWYEGLVDTTPFQKKFRSKHDVLEIPEDFPNPLVVDAYYHPTVDKSEQKFEWGQPQLDSLRVYLTGAFSWSEEKVDQVLLPVLREMNSKKSNTANQPSIETYYKANKTVSSAQRQHSSKRVRSVVDEWKSQKKRKPNSGR
ncbi:hypothetical protein MFLAVUS_004716 [Mucor flavus]|uniref:Uncharacterized protein n=1 Tax=Mucor flavus TaxID=439312 RepID=A0ABP9YWN9_9FUNG